MAREPLPNTPLVEVTSEARFPGDLSFFGSWGEIHQALRARFPKLYVPVSQPGLSPLLQHMKLTTPDEVDVVLLALNSIGFSTRRYSVYQEFEERFLFAYELMRKHVHVDAATRFGLRYTNVLPPVPPDEIAEDLVHPALKLRLSGLESIGQNNAAQPQIVSERAQGQLHLRVVVAPRPNVVAEVSGAQINIPLAAGITLDLDCYQTDPGSLDGMLQFLRDAHHLVDSAFFGLISDDYLGYLKGQA